MNQDFPIFDLTEANLCDFDLSITKYDSIGKENGGLNSKNEEVDFRELKEQVRYDVALMGLFLFLSSPNLGRRRKLESQRAFAAISDDEIPVRSSKMMGKLAAVQMLIRRRTMGLKRIKVKKPKFALKIDDSDLASFFLAFR